MLGPSSSNDEIGRESLRLAPASMLAGIQKISWRDCKSSTTIMEASLNQRDFASNVKENDATMPISTTKGATTMLTRRNVLRGVALSSVTLLAVGVLPYSAAQQVIPATPAVSPYLLVDGWLLHADDR